MLIQVYQGGRKGSPVTNKLLGAFELSGIAPAPRGVPQIEVTLETSTRTASFTSPQRPQHRQKQSA